MLTSISWVPKGAMKAVPLRTNDTIEEVREKLRKRNPEIIAELTGKKAGITIESAAKAAEAEEEGGSRPAVVAEKASKSKKTKEVEVESDSYEDEEDDDEIDPDNIFHRFAGDIAEDLPSDDDEDEKDDNTYKDTDLVFAVARADEEEPKIELFVYDDLRDCTYVHHDAVVSAYPLCSTWLTDGQLSMLAIGTMLPFIEIWPLDVSDAVEPAVILGGCVKMEDNYRRKIKKDTLKPDSHSAAIMCLDWNTNAQHILASGSADDTIKIWDLNTRGCVGTFKEASKVQSIQFHHEESNLLLSGGFDKCAAVRDCRRPDEAALRWMQDDIVEHVEWAFHANQIVVSTSDGCVSGYDVRAGPPAAGGKGGKKKGNGALWSVMAHNADATFSLSRHLPGLMATGGQDGFTSLWDIRCNAASADAAKQRVADKYRGLPQGDCLHENGPNGPTLIVSRMYKTGSILSTKFHPNVWSVLGSCGSKGEPLIYTMAEDLKGFFTPPNGYQGSDPTK